LAEHVLNLVSCLAEGGIGLSGDGVKWRRHCEEWVDVVEFMNGRRGCD
jgi:hypothetical protein